MRAIVLCLFLFACNDYVNTFWSESEEVNRCFPVVKEYWEKRLHTIYVDMSGMEILIVKETDCKKGAACLKWDDWIIEMEERVIDSPHGCDVVAHEIGHGLGFDHEHRGLMREIVRYTDPVQLPKPIN